MRRASKRSVLTSSSSSARRRTAPRGRRRRESCPLRRGCITCSSVSMPTRPTHPPRRSCAPCSSSRRHSELACTSTRSSPTPTCSSSQLPTSRAGLALASSAKSCRPSASRCGRRSGTSPTPRAPPLASTWRVRWRGTGTSLRAGSTAFSGGVTHRSTTCTTRPTFWTAWIGTRRTTLWSSTTLRTCATRSTWATGRSCAPTLTLMRSYRQRCRPTGSRKPA
mmetsp:Transcript_40974/g.98353  ORF Transcript_40974/g.98353 Transcript_40974/m.98353 type:complete len:222 (+) Transcript_40974:1131-1796(+)